MATLRRKLLVIDDDEASCRLIKAIFAAEDVEVVAAYDSASGISRAAKDRPDLVLLDLHLPGIDGLAVLEKLKAATPALPIIMLTAHQEVRAAVRATQLGAFDYMTKPVDPEEIVLVVRRALRTQELEQEVLELRRQVGEGGGLAEQMGPSSQVKQIIEQVRAVAASSFSVLIVGETGTGKELVAQAVHRQSERRDRPFVAVDCGAIPEQLLESELFGHEKGAFTGASSRKEGRFQLAQGGTFFLDEVGNLPLSLQAKLLRVLESRQVQPVGGAHTNPLDLRFIAATNDDLQDRVHEGRFRPDLYFRLAQYTIALPPLRDRPSDIPYLTQRFVAEASVELRRPVQQVVPEALELLQEHAWQGNVRELRNVVRQAVLHTKDLVIRREVLRPLLGRSGAKRAAVQRVNRSSLKTIADEAARAAERQAISDTLRTTRGNKSQAARALQTDYKTLHVKMKRLGLRSRDFLP